MKSEIPNLCRRKDCSFAFICNGEKKFLLTQGARRKRFCGTTAKDLVAILDPELCDQRDVAPLDIAMEAARSLMKRHESTFLGTRKTTAIDRVTIIRYQRAPIAEFRGERGVRIG